MITSRLLVDANIKTTFREEEIKGIKCEFFYEPTKYFTVKCGKATLPGTFMSFNAAKKAATAYCVAIALTVEDENRNKGGRPKKIKDDLPVKED